MRIYTIYLATNLINGKHYVGFDSKWPRRRQCHKDEAANHQSHTYATKFHNAIRKHGWVNFSWQVVYQSVDREHTLLHMEEHFINEYQSFVNSPAKGYNLTMGGEGQKLRPMSAGTRAKKSIALHNKPSPLSRMIQTPHGKFLGERIAARTLCIPLRTLSSRLASNRFINWYYVDAPKSNVVPPRKCKPSRLISTSHGIFENIHIASETLNILKSTIEARIRSKHSPEWYRE